MCLRCCLGSDQIPLILFASSVHLSCSVCMFFLLMACVCDSLRTGSLGDWHHFVMRAGSTWPFHPPGEALSCWLTNAALPKTGSLALRCPKHIYTLELPCWTRLRLGFAPNHTLAWLLLLPLILPTPIFSWECLLDKSLALESSHGLLLEKPYLRWYKSKPSSYS